MMVRRFSSRSNLPTSLGVLMLLLAPLAIAQPAGQLLPPEAALDIIEGATFDWVTVLTADEPAAAAELNEQVFTELSPLLDSPDAVRLPPDQDQEN